MDEGTGRKRSGREGRRARRSEVKGQAPAFITRAIPFYEILGEEGLDRIDTQAHKRWKQVLATVEPPPLDDRIAADDLRRAIGSTLDPFCPTERRNRLASG